LRKPWKRKEDGGVLEDDPILRIFGVEKAKEFYVGYLGSSVDWEHHGSGKVSGRSAPPHCRPGNECSETNLIAASAWGRVS
jgi:hypothetical protein